jgi:hypothetical protein
LLFYEKLLTTKRGIEPKRPITFDKAQFGPVLQTFDLLYKARNGGFATYETVKDNLLNSVGKLLYLPYAKSLRSQTGTAFIALLAVIYKCHS